MRTDPLPFNHHRIMRVHVASRKSGFWDSFERVMKLPEGDLKTLLLDALAVQKLALIATEIDEYYDASEKVNGSPREDVLEELADIVIRTFDFCGSMNFTPSVLGDPRAWLKNITQSDTSESYLALKMHRAISGAVEAIRRVTSNDGDPTVTMELSNLLALCYISAHFNYTVDALEDAIDMKIAKNARRQRLHGKRF